MKKEVKQQFAESGVSEDSQFLLAVSGGVDSMVLLDLFCTLKLNCVVAHCNFGLRGIDSDQDETLVNEVCSENGVQFYSKKISLDSYKKENHVSTQMAARELRYQWFGELMKELKCDYLVTAHHFDDSIETFLLNLSRGTGIEGLLGIKSLSQGVFRPLISSTKTEVRQYAKTHQVKYREDASNSSDAYKRNKIRNHVIPVLNELNTSFSQTMHSNLNNLKEVASFYNDSMNHLFQSLISEKDGRMEICIEKLIGQQHKELLLFEGLRKYGFDRSQTDQMIEVLEGKQPIGKQFFSPTHRLLLDRVSIFIEEISEQKNEIFVLNNQNKFVTSQVKLTFKQIPIDEVELLPNSHYAFLDSDKIEFPIVLRKWKEGDKFRPFGMRGKKKVSDFLIDKKLSRMQKENTWVLLSNNQIFWVVGHRIDDSFKLTDSSNTILKVTFESN